MSGTTRVLAAMFLATALGTSAASAQWESGKRYAGPHIGLSGVGSTFSIGAAFEQAYNKNIGIGASVDYWSYGFGGGNDFDYTYIALAVLGSYHFPLSDTKLDPFLGLGL